MARIYVVVMIVAMLASCGYEALKKPEYTDLSSSVDVEISTSTESVGTAKPKESTGVNSSSLAETAAPTESTESSKPEESTTPQKLLSYQEATKMVFENIGFDQYYADNAKLIDNDDFYGYVLPTVGDTQLITNKVEYDGVNIDGKYYSITWYEAIVDNIADGNVRNVGIDGFLVEIATGKILSISQGRDEYYSAYLNE